MLFISWFRSWFETVLFKFVILYCSVISEGSCTVIKVGPDPTRISAGREMHQDSPDKNKSSKVSSVDTDYFILYWVKI